MRDLPPLDPDGVTVGQLSPRQGLRRVYAGTLPRQNGGGQSATPQTATETTGSANIDGVPGLVTGAMMTGASMTPLGKVPGALSGFGAAIQGASLDAIQDAILGDVMGWLGSTATSELGLGYGLPGIAGAVARETVKDDPNYGAAAIGAGVKTGIGMIGNALAGPFGGIGLSMLGGPMVDNSLQQGYLGDMAGSRSREKERDAVEGAFGVSVGDTAGMARVDSLEGYLNDLSDRMEGISAQPSTHDLSMTSDVGYGPFGFGLESFNDSTTSGKLSSAIGEDPFGSLEGFLDGRDGNGAADSGTDGGYGDPDAGGEGMI